MGEYDTMQVCLNGHKITDRYYRSPEHRQKFCEKCGEETITECQECGTEIRGYYHVEGVISPSSTDVPEFCHECGAAYPWVTE